jgi:Ca2+/H+ antiporter
MRDIWKPIEKSWAARVGVLTYAVVFCAIFMHWTTVRWVAALIFVGCCAAIAEAQVRILKEHIEKLEERLGKLEAQTKRYA